MKKILIVLVLVICIVGALFLVRHKKQRIAMAPVQHARTVVRTAPVVRGNLTVSRSYLARIEPWKTAGVSAQIVSRVTDISVQEGDSVSQGQTLAVLDMTEHLARVRVAEAARSRSRMQAQAMAAIVDSLEKTMRFREHELERDALLVREGALAQVVAEASADRLSEVRGRLDAQRKTVRAAHKEIVMRGREVEQAQAALAYARIQAPFDGIITQRLADPGDMAGPSQKLMIIEDHRRFKIAFDVPQSEMATLRQGLRVSLASGAELPLTISRIHPALNEDRTVTVECDTSPGADLYAGSTVLVTVMLHQYAHELLVPEESLVPAPDGNTTVFAVMDGVTVPHAVTVIGRDHGVVAVRGVSLVSSEKNSVPATTATSMAGVAPAPLLSEGAQVILSTYLGWNRLAAGEPVEVQP